MFWKELWDAARDLWGTNGLSYLTGPKSKDQRALVLPAGVDGPVLRFLAHCPSPKSGKAGGRIVPAVLALYRDVLTDQPRAISRIGLWPNGTKIERWDLGNKIGTAIKLMPVTAGKVCLAESVENALAAHMLGHAPVWATGGRAGIANFFLVDGINELGLLLDNDVEHDSQKSGVEAFERYTADGRDAWFDIPGNPNQYFNDLVGQNVITDEPDNPKPPENERARIRQKSKILPFSAEKKKKGNGSKAIKLIEPDEPTSGDGEVTSPIYSEDYIALKFAKIHQSDARFVDKWGVWFLWRQTYWKRDRVRQAFDASRKVCREVALKIKKSAQQKKIASGATVAAVKRLAEADERIGMGIESWDQDLLIFNDLFKIVDSAKPKTEENEGGVNQNGVVAHDIPAFSSVYSLSLFLISSLNSSISLTTMPSPNSTLPSGVKCRLPLRVSRLKREVEETHPKQVRKLQQASLSPHRFRLALITGIVEPIFLSGNNHSPLNTLSLRASIFTS
jgi:hypothetical protein